MLNKRNRVRCPWILHGLVAALSITWTTVAGAKEDGRGQSIMFDQDRRYLTEKPQQADPRWEHCQELSRKVEALKGRPQRRYAAAQRYEAECKGLNN